MDRRLAKRHKRQVSREKARVNLSQPDLRTPEQIRAAREASRPAGRLRNEPNPVYANRRRDSAAVAANPTAKADG
jgi:hypothetical protein